MRPVLCIVLAAVLLGFATSAAAEADNSNGGVLEELENLFWDVLSAPQDSRAQRSLLASTATPPTYASPKKSPPKPSPKKSPPKPSPKKSPPKPSPKCILPTPKSTVTVVVYVKNNALKNWGAVRDFLARKTGVSKGYFSGTSGQVPGSLPYRLTVQVPGIKTCTTSRAAYNSYPARLRGLIAKLRNALKSTEFAKSQVY